MPRPPHRKQPAVLRVRPVALRRWAGVLLLALALVWQSHALWRHQLDGHADAAAGHTCVQCLAFAGADHALPALPVQMVVATGVPVYAAVIVPTVQRAVVAPYQARAPPH